MTSKPEVGICKPKVGICKNLFCRDKSWRLYNNYYGKDVFANIPGARLRSCSYGDTCRGAHTEQEIHTLPHIHNFNVMDKSKIDLAKRVHILVGGGTGFRGPGFLVLHGGSGPPRGDPGPRAGARGGPSPPLPG